MYKLKVRSERVCLKKESTLNKHISLPQSMGMIYSTVAWLRSSANINCDVRTPWRTGHILSSSLPTSQSKFCACHASNSVRWSVRERCSNEDCKLWCLIKMQRNSQLQTTLLAKTARDQAHLIVRFMVLSTSTGYIKYIIITP